MKTPVVRKGQGPPPLAREEFRRRFRARFFDPAFESKKEAVDALEAIGWQAYDEARKAPRTRKAGPEFADPSYDLSVEWLETRERLRAAEARHRDRSTPPRVLLICGASRNDKTCPGEVSKTFRLVECARETLLAQRDDYAVDVLDLSLLTSEYGRQIHPCKACVSTAMPLCHWPCSCYPNHALGQTHDWMAEIYERWVLAHGIIIVTPVYWYQVPSGLKLMIDRLVCADGGNADPTTTSGKDPEKAKALELDGWSYPKHLAGRAYGVVVHGDVAGIEAVKYALSSWLDWMRLVDAGARAKLDRYVGYYEPYATSHDALDGDEAFFEEVRNVTRAVAHAVEALRAGGQLTADDELTDPRAK